MLNVSNQTSRLSLSPASSTMQSSFDHTNLQSKIKTFKLEIDDKDSIIRHKEELYHLELNQIDQCRSHQLFKFLSIVM